ncbi:MAG: ATP-dependent metalloprotease FtsH [Modestobacter sp.]|nr:ATP-dependent metalloprotease FtsH [Modestobacter sp.]
MRPRQPRLPVRHGAVGTARRPAPSVEDEPHPARPSPAPTRRNRPWLALVAVVVYAALFFGPGLVSSSSATSLAYSTFLTDVSNHGVASVAVSGTGALSGTLTGGREFTSQAPPWALSTDDLATRLEAAGVHVSAYQQNDTIVQVALALLPTLLLVGAFWWLGRRAQRTLGGGGGLGGLMRTKARVTDAERPTTRFEDVAGYEGAKQEVREVVDYLQHPERYRRAGAQGPRGLLLVGPPGTGKTLLARAVAGEASVPFFAVTGSSFVEVFVGLGASRVRDLFSEARRSAPAIVFIDEIDAIGARRAVTGAGGTNDEREQTLNQLLSEMDGFTGNGSIVVIAATNRPEVLDQALLRPGRFDRQVTVPLPNLRDRQRILAVHVQGKQLAADVDLGIVARGTAGFSGADLANLVNEAALRAARADRVDVRRVDFDEARDRLILGRREDSNALLPQERTTVAVHEGGHALVAALSPTGDPVAKITILPAGMALGATHQLPEDDRRLYSESYLLDSLAIRVAGRAAELLVSGEASTGAADDLAGATQLAVRMVREYGFSTELGPVAYPLPAATQLDTTGLDRPYAEATQRQVDDEVGRLLRDAEARATELLTLHRTALDSLTRHLLEEETVDGSVVYDLLLHPHGTGDRPRLVDGE